MTADQYLYPRVCPILSVSHEDLVHCIEVYGRAVTFETLAFLIVQNYDFPYARACNPRVQAPSILGPPRAQGKPAPASATTLLGGYRCTRLGSDLRIPGITLSMRDSLSRLDWSLDSFMEQHRMKCWVAVQGKTRRWADSRNDLRSPYIRCTNALNLTKILDAEDAKAMSHLDHGALRDIVMGNVEAMPPTVELYLQTIDKLNPSSIWASQVTYGVSLGAMACVVSEDLPCHYDLSSLSPEAAGSLREFVTASGKPLVESSPDSPPDLVFIDATPFGTHDLRAYLGERSTPRHVSYTRHLRRILRQLRSLADESQHPPTRIALVISLRELPAQPTIEPLLLAILSDKELAARSDLVGALMSQKRDYAVYLMLMHSTKKTAVEEKRSLWEKRLADNYPELSPGISRTEDSDPEEEAVTISSIRQPAESSQRSGRVKTSSAPEAWETICLNAALSKMVDGVAGISAQGPRTRRGKNVFPTRTRNCVIVSETTNLETGDIIYVFGDSHEPPLPVEVSPSSCPGSDKVITDPLLSRMVSGIQQSMTSCPSG